MEKRGFDPDIEIAEDGLNNTAVDLEQGALDELGLHESTEDSLTEAARARLAAMTQAYTEAVEPRYLVMSHWGQNRIAAWRIGDIILTECTWGSSKRTSFVGTSYGSPRYLVDIHRGNREIRSVPDYAPRHVADMLADTIAAQTPQQAG